MKGEIRTLTSMIAFPQLELQFNRASNLVPKVLGRVGQDYENEVECSVVTACTLCIFRLFTDPLFSL